MRKLLSHSLWGRAMLVWSACSVLSVLCGVTACFVARAWCLWCFENQSNKLLSKSCGDCWAIRSEAEQCCFVSMQACSVLSVLCGATACFVARAWCLWCFENHQINCWANRAEIVEPFALRQSNVVLSACRHAVSWVYSVGLLLVLLPERDACDALRTIK